jgi:hypothetical protein
VIGSKKRALRLNVGKYSVMEGDLGWRNPNDLIFRCINSMKAQILMNEMHNGLYGGNFAAKTTIYKILRVGYYLPTVYFDVHNFVRSCQSCQLFAKKVKVVTLPLQPVIVEAPFQLWDLDFIGKFHPNSSNGYKWIITAIDYFTRWVKAIPTKKAPSNH